MTAATVQGKRLQALAIAFADAGVPNREEKVLLAGIMLSRPEITTTNELTADETHRLLRWLDEDPLIVERARARAAAADRPAPTPRSRRKKGTAPSVPVVPVAPPCPPTVAGPPPGTGPCDDVEAAAQAAADRHRARGGVIATPPAPHEVPPRVPVPYVAVGRYCIPAPGTCYCGSCSHHEPIPEPNYRAAIAALREKATGGRR